MALSLDYIGRFVIMTVAIAVAISLILSFRGDVLNTDTTPEGDEEIETEVVNIEIDSDYHQEAQQYTNLCYEKGQQRAEDFTCFILSAQGGKFDGKVKNYFDDSFGSVKNSDEDIEECNTITVKYELGSDGVFIDDYKGDC